MTEMPALTKEARSVKSSIEIKSELNLTTES